MRTQNAKLNRQLPRRLGLAVTCLLVCLAAPSLCGAETVSRIKLIIDDQNYVWETGQAQPTCLAGQFLDPALPLHLAGLVPGQTITGAAMDAKIIDTQRLLENCNLFNDVQVFFLPAADNPDQVSFFMILRTGFSLRFGGGIAYLMLGNDNVDGQLLRWRTWIGYNQVGGSIGQGLVDNEKIYFSPYFWAVNLLYQNNGLDPSVQSAWVHSPSLELQLGTGSYPWFGHLTLKAKGNFSQFGAYNWIFQASPELGLEKVWGFDYLDKDGAIIKPANSLTLGLSAGADLAWLLPEAEFRSRVLGRVYTRVQLGILTLASQVYGVWSPQAVPDRFAVDIKATDDRSIRSNYDDAYLLADHCLVSSSELRLRVASFKWGIIREFDIDPFLFYDTAVFGRIKNPGDALFGNAASAFGLGLRLLMSSPVNTDFSFTLGLNPDSFNPATGKAPLRFAMTVTGGF